ncbi:MAG: lipid-A-disaccharide synthase N-terminal domain-containing protein [Candidatus Omnitrophica bacterium]|nr:lipid-A-disaccharide synthase N-terminal domain-containing protein [Candidatus Omnitrophota bacterium]MDE2221727.1 lipid-A-disaccharide synthase N-terminal domain-containing protein [Candidatus Omnitrophota bacterium]
MYFYNFHIDAWTIIGLAGQFLFFLSFAVQWYRSEQAKRSILPQEFWLLRLIASLLLIAYVLHRRDIVFLIAAILQIIFYLRNIILIKGQE